MAWADRMSCDEITQIDLGLRYLLKISAAAPSVALQAFLSAAEPNPGKWYLFEDSEVQLPGRINPDDTPCLVMAPATMDVEAWRSNQNKIDHAVAILGFITARSRVPLNIFAMRTLRALFQFQGRIPDATPAAVDASPNDPDAWDLDAFKYDPATKSLDFVQATRLAGGVSRTPIARLGRDQSGEMDDDAPAWYRWWGFRVPLVIEARSGLLAGG